MRARCFPRLVAAALLFVVGVSHADIIVVSQWSNGSQPGWKTGGIGNGVECVESLVGKTYSAVGSLNTDLMACTPGGSKAGTDPGCIEPNCRRWSGGTGSTQQIISASSASEGKEVRYARHYACSSTYGLTTCTASQSNRSYGEVYAVYMDATCPAGKAVNTTTLKCETVTAPPSNPCAAKNGQKAYTASTGTMPTTGTLCVSGCRATMNGGLDVGSGWTAWGQYNGEQCTADNTQSTSQETLPDGTKGVCIGDKCVSETKRNCGYVNNSYRCITDSQLTPENPCVQTQSGGVFCISSAPTPPAPNNGTEGQKANSDANFGLNTKSNGTGTGQTVNYYNSGTVGGDSGNPGGDGQGDGDGEEQAEPCGDEAKPCKITGDPTEGNLKGYSAPTITASTSAFMAAVQQAPLFAAANNLTAINAGPGTCPPLDMNLPLLGQVGTGIHCELTQENSSAFAAVFLLIYSLIGIRIVMSA